MKFRAIPSMRLAKTERLILALLACFSLLYWLTSGRVWLGLDESKVSINGRSLSEGSDYSIFRSLDGDIFSLHQDHGAQYLISPARKEVSIISEGEDVITLDSILFSESALATLEDGSSRKKLPNPKLIVREGFVEFTGVHEEQWRMSY